MQLQKGICSYQIDKLSLFYFSHRRRRSLSNLLRQQSQAEVVKGRQEKLGPVILIQINKRGFPDAVMKGVFKEWSKQRMLLKIAEGSKCSGIFFALKYTHALCSAKIAQMVAMAIEPHCCVQRHLACPSSAQRLELGWVSMYAQRLMVLS